MEKLNLKNSYLNVNHASDFQPNPIILNNQKSNISDLFLDQIEKQLLIAITHILHELGMPSHVNGYLYVRLAIEIIYLRPISIDGIVKEVYTEIADQFNTTISNVERSIRHAIEISWSRGDLRLMEEIFGHSINLSRSKPTNSEFMMTIADLLRLDRTVLLIDKKR